MEYTGQRNYVMKTCLKSQNLILNHGVKTSKKRRLKWLGHLVRQDNNTTTKQALTTANSNQLQDQCDVQS